MRSWTLSLVLISTLSIGCATKSGLQVDRSTPEMSFETWRQAVIQMDTLALVDCYVLEARDGMRKELSETTQNGIDSMRAETAKTKFEIEKVVYQQDKAFVRIRREFNGVSDIELLTMVKEDGQWRLIP